MVIFKRDNMPTDAEKNIATMRSPDLSIIIVSWNCKALLKECLASIKAQDTDIFYELIVIDNDSQDGSPEMVKVEFQHVRLIQLKKNLGFAKANNIGINRSNSPYICLINPDIRVLPGCIDALYRYVTAHPEVGMVAPRILNPDMTVQPSCYAEPGVVNSITTAFGINKISFRSRLICGFYEKYWPYSMSQEVDVLSGCFWMMRRKALEEVGLLDENFFFGWEDFDWCKRFKTSGWKLVYLVEPQAVHHHYGSSSNNPGQSAIESEKGHLLYWEKHYGRAGKTFVAGAILTRHALQLLKHNMLHLYNPSIGTKNKIGQEKNRAVITYMLKISIK